MASPKPTAAIVAESLTLAMVHSSDAPLLLLDGELRVIAASKTFGRSFGIDVSNAAGKLVFELGSGEWDSPKLRSLLDATAAGLAAIDAYEIELIVEGKAPRSLVVKAQKLDYQDAAVTRLIVTLSDVTEARLAERVKDDLVREKAVLLQELQHRVANSLQIIASVLMQSARKVQSDEARLHLTEAHGRVLSIAQVQQQLARSGSEEVALRPYFSQLCQSLGASMIRDHNQQSIDVTSDSSVVRADVSVSLGLIVTELVINALKHAFPEGRGGRILVDYHSKGGNWTLSVADNGVGMPDEAAPAKAGLGTSIVEALARQLHARIKVTDAKPGTQVSVAHANVALVGAEEADPAIRAV